MNRQFVPKLLRSLLVAAVFCAPSAWAEDEDLVKARELVAEAQFTIERILADDKMGKAARAQFRSAKAVLIVPSMLKAGLILAGEGGSGVLLAKADTGEWSYPAFYSVGSGSVGLQLGAQKSELLLFIMTGKGLEIILDGSGTVGGELNAAVGTFGETREAATTVNFGPDIVSIGVNDGAFIGASVEGAIVFSNASRNAAFYGNEDAVPEAVVLRGEFANADADALREQLTKLTAFRN